MNVQATSTRMAAGLFALVASSALVAYYFFGVENGRQSVMEPWRNFYSQLHPGWAKLTEVEMRDVLKKGDAQPMTLLPLRAALGRWRLRTQAPEAFDLLMREYERGLWMSDDKQAWARTLQWLDDTWVEARRAVKRSGTQTPAPRIAREGTDGLAIIFADATDAATIGSRIRVALDASYEASPKEAPKVYWETDRAQGVSAYRRRLATWDVSTTTTENGLHRVSLELDMSWEPMWLAPGVKGRALHLRSPGASSWKNFSLQFDDSPLLPTD